MGNFDFTEPAIQDLQNIRKYTIKKWGQFQWADYFQLLSDTFNNLAEDPQIGTPRIDLPEGILSFLEVEKKQHRIYYRKIKGGIMIARILHHAQDIDQEFE